MTTLAALAENPAQSSRESFLSFPNNNKKSQPFCLSRKIETTETILLRKKAYFDKLSENAISEIFFFFDT